MSPCWSPSFFSITSSKVLISFDLRLRNVSDGAQNLEPQGLASKILRNKELALGSAMEVTAKVFVSFELRLSDIRESVQGIEMRGLTHEMLWNRELARHFREPGPMAGANSRKVPARIFSILLPAFFSVKVVGHKMWILCCGKEEKEHYMRRVPKSPAQAELGRGTLGRLAWASPRKRISARSCPQG